MARILALLTVLLGLVVPRAEAQAPKAGEYFTDDTDLGFRVKSPKDWGFFPPKPGDPHMIGRYAGNTVQVSGDERLELTVFLVKFDRRPDEDGNPKRTRYKDLKSWMNARLNGAPVWNVAEEKDFKAGGVPATEYVFTGITAKKTELGAYAALYRLSPEVEVALVANGPGERKWSKYQSAYKKLAKTFKPVEIEAAAPAGPGGGSVREQKRRMLQDQANRTPGWRLFETENYFVITNSEDDAFLKELMGRIEAIRAVYEVDYPPESARIAKQPGEEEEEEEEEVDPDRTVSERADPMELSRTSVVRVCATRDDYLGYGAPPRSGGYWSSFHEELVVYNKKREEGEDATWETLSHEAFHQYIYYFYGSLAPHSWYNEGTGDYYGGHEYKRKKFQRAPRRMRKDSIKETLREGRTIPLKEFVRWSQRQYYGENDYGLSGFDCYGQGWAFIYFLRMGKKARGWNSDWDGILGTYLDTLVDTGDLDLAVDKAFEGVDWDELETCWKTFVDKQL